MSEQLDELTDDQLSEPVPAHARFCVLVGPAAAGKVTAVLDTFGEWLPARAWIDSLHRTLHLGDVGRVYSELAASWLWVLALSGLSVWIVRRRRHARVRRTLLPERSARGRARIRSWHGSVGSGSRSACWCSP